MIDETCPACDKRRSYWSENNRRGCRGEDGSQYCSQLCAGRVRPAARSGRRRGDVLADIYAGNV